MKIILGLTFLVCLVSASSSSLSSSSSSTSSDCSDKGRDYRKSKNKGKLTGQFQNLSLKARRAAQDLTIMTPVAINKKIDSPNVDSPLTDSSISLNSEELPSKFVRPTNKYQKKSPSSIDLLRQETNFGSIGRKFSESVSHGDNHILVDEIDMMSKLQSSKKKSRDCQKFSVSLPSILDRNDKTIRNRGSLPKKTFFSERKKASLPQLRTRHTIIPECEGVDRESDGKGNTKIYSSKIQGLDKDRPKSALLSKKFSNPRDNDSGDSSSTSSSDSIGVREKNSK